MRVALTKRKRWIGTALLDKAHRWSDALRKRIGAGRERSAWWCFAAEWADKHPTWLQDFRAGTHRFSPRRMICFADEVVYFAGARTRQRQTPVKPTVHARTCRRALDRIQAMRSDAVHPAKMQRYLIRWATWWSQVVCLTREELLRLWVQYGAAHAPPALWIGRGLITFS